MRAFGCWLMYVQLERGFSILREAAGSGVHADKSVPASRSDWMEAFPCDVFLDIEDVSRKSSKTGSEIFSTWCECNLLTYYSRATTVGSDISCV